MAKITKISCPGCGGSLKAPEDREKFFCLYCGNLVLIEEENKKKIEITKIEKKEKPAIDCEVCGGTIFSQEESKFKCKKCGKIVCKECYDIKENRCKDCWRIDYSKAKKLLKWTWVTIGVIVGLGLIGLILYSTISPREELSHFGEILGFGSYITFLLLVLFWLPWTIWNMKRVRRVFFKK
jgi:predicted RNA-binding Zn-ribbon protein involved in translation (DUF1610 family)